MARLFDRFLAKPNITHLSDEEIISVLESIPPAPLGTEQLNHLESCWKCLARKQQLQDTIFKIVGYQQVLLSPFLPPPPGAEERLVARLNQREPPSERRWFSSLRANYPEIRVNIAIASAFIVLVVIGALIAIRKHPASHTISAQVFLENIKTFDTSQVNGKPGVVLQRVRIDTPKRTIERSLYFDTHRIRHPKVNQKQDGGEPLKAQLTAAGVDWEEPLSAESFLTWHDRAPVRQESVIAVGKDLLTLTTVLSTGAIANESLTVREADFHPIARSVKFRDEGTVEIAELDYKVLGWNATTESIFGPARPDSLPASSSVTLPSAPSQEILDEIELRARLILNHLGADATEQIVFSHSREGIVEISAVVETEARKRELLTQLRALPYLTTSIQSVEGLSARDALHQQPVVAGTAVYSEVSGPSPLSLRFQQKGRSPDDAEQISKQALDTALVIQQESTAIEELFQRFPSGSDLTGLGRTALAELLTRHFEKLDNALEAEQRVIRPVQDVSRLPLSDTPRVPSSKPESMVAAASRNKALVTELISGANASSRSTDEIVADILESLAEIRRVAQTAKATAHTVVAPDHPVQK